MTPLVNWHLSLQTIGRFQYWSVSALLAVARCQRVSVSLGDLVSSDEVVPSGVPDELLGHGYETRD